MNIKKLEQYGIGPRTLKTALAALSCIVISKLINYEYLPSYACVTTCIAMQDTSERSIELGKNRLMSTLLAGALSLFAIMLLDFFGHIALSPYFAPFIMIIGFAVCNIANRKELCSLTGVIILAIMLGDLSVTPIAQAVRRLLETGAGVVIAVIINKYIMPMKNPSNHDCETDDVDSTEKSSGQNKDLGSSNESGSKPDKAPAVAIPNQKGNKKNSGSKKNKGKKKKHAKKSKH